jgi:hypothetical protein
LIEKPNNCNVFGRKKTKEPHQYDQKWGSLVFLRPKTLQLFGFSINHFSTSWWGSLVFFRPKTLQLFSFSINHFWTSWWGSLVFLRPKTLQLFGFTINHFWTSWWGSLFSCVQRHYNHLAFQSFELTWWSFSTKSNALYALN